MTHGQARRRAAGMSRIVAWFTELSYRRAGLVIVAIALVLGAGALSATRINQELIPDIEFPLIVVVAQAPETQPGEVVRSTIAPIEAGTAGLEGLQSTQSTSVQGLGVLLLSFDFGVDLQGTQEEVGRSSSRSSSPRTSRPARCSSTRRRCR
ncbi:MAG: hypothetical protein GEU80_07495 [Dehalococcoidia bacterium]|nr:hypothetical protein [Dehalococcoidia bacterium]